MAVVQDTIAAFEFLFGRRIPNYRLLGELLSTASKETEDVRSLLYMTAMSEFVRLPVCKSEATFLAVQTDLLSLLEVRRRAGASVRWDEKSESYQPVVRPKLPEWMGLTGYMIILVILFGLVPALFRDIESAYIVALSWLSPDRRIGFDALYATFAWTPLRIAILVVVALIALSSSEPPKEANALVERTRKDAVNRSDALEVEDGEHAAQARPH